MEFKEYKEYKEYNECKEYKDYTEYKCQILSYNNKCQDNEYYSVIKL